MPNHVTHRMTITGSPAAVNALIDRHFPMIMSTNLKGEEIGQVQILNFHSIIPMPDTIKNTTSGGTNRVEEALATGDLKALRPYLDDTWVRDAGVKKLEDLPEFLAKHYRMTIEELKTIGKNRIQNRELYGHADWYGWSVANWGTKWNAYAMAVVKIGVSEDQNGPSMTFEVTFQTAWSSPEPIFHKLAELHPEVSFDVTGFDEGWNFAYVGKAAKGVFEGGEVEATDELYEFVHGHPREKDPDEAVVDDDKEAAD